MDFADEMVGLMPRLRLFALKLTKDEDRAGDLVQTVLLRALEKREHYEDGNLAGWLMTMMYHCWVNGVRRSVREGRSVPIDSPTFVETDWQLQVPAPADSRMELAEAERALATLAPEKREVVLLIGQGANYDEVAAVLGINVGTVRSRLSRGRDELRIAACREVGS